MAAPVAIPDQGLESYNQQIALHPLPAGTPTPQQTVTPPSSGAAADSGAVFASAAPAHVTGAPDAASFAAAQMPAAAAAAPGVVDSGPAVTAMPMTTSSTVSDSHSVITSSSGFESYGWFIVPSTSNQYGEGIGDGAFKIDLAGDIITDWYFV